MTEAAGWGRQAAECRDVCGAWQQPQQQQQQQQQQQGCGECRNAAVSLAWSAHTTAQLHARGVSLTTVTYSAVIRHQDHSQAQSRCRCRCLANQLNVTLETNSDDQLVHARGQWARGSVDNLATTQNGTYAKPAYDLDVAVDDKDELALASL